MRAVRTGRTTSTKMMRRGAIVFAVGVAAFVALSGIGMSKAKDPPWVAKDWTQWSGWDCENIQNYSPWAYYLDNGGRETDLRVYPSGYGDGGFYLAQLMSALPIRQSFRKQAESLKYFDKMNAQKKQAFDEEYAKKNVKYDGGQVLISWSSYDKSSFGQSRQGALVLSDGSLVMPIATKLSCSLTLVEFGTRIEHNISVCAEYVFPRTVRGKPPYTAEDKELVFVQGAVLPYHGKTEEFGPQRPEDFRLVDSAPTGCFHFPISTLIYKGKLEY